MRKYLALAVLALPLGACASLQNPLGNDAGKISIQNAAIAGCGFIPTIDTVTSILATDPKFAKAALTEALISQVAEAICKAVTAPVPHGFIAGQATVTTLDGVPLIGAFVTRR